MSYITLAELKSYLGIASTKTGDDSLLEELIEQAQEEIDNHTHRRPKAGWPVFEGTTGTFYYRSDDLYLLRETGDLEPHYSWDSQTVSRGVLWLGRDCISVGTLTNGDGTVISSTGYWLEPRNGPPYSFVRLRTGESWIFQTDGEINVAGTWGYSTAPPKEVKGWVKELAAYLYRLKDSQVFDVTAFPEAGVLQIPKGTPLHVKQSIDKSGLVKQRGPQ